MNHLTVFLLFFTHFWETSMRTSNVGKYVF